MQNIRADLAPAPDPFTVENLTKIVGAFTAIALGTGILFDVVFFTIIDRNFMDLMVLSDHIESAAATVPFLVVFFLWMAGGVWLVRRVRHIPLTYWMFPFALFFFLGIGAWWWVPGVQARLSEPTIRNSTVGLLLLFLAVAVIGAWVAEMTEAKLVLLICFAWVGLTVLKASTEAFQATTPTRFAFRPPAHIFLANEGILTGGIIRQLDRGLILFSEPGRRYTFIPREQIRRIDHFRRTEAGQAGG